MSGSSFSASSGAFILFIIIFVAQSSSSGFFLSPLKSLPLLFDVSVVILGFHAVLSTCFCVKDLHIVRSFSCSQKKCHKSYSSKSHGYRGHQSLPENSFAPLDDVLSCLFGYEQFYLFRLLLIPTRKPLSHFFVPLFFVLGVIGSVSLVLLSLSLCLPLVVFTGLSYVLIVLCLRLVSVVEPLSSSLLAEILILGVVILIGTSIVGTLSVLFFGCL